MPTTVIITATVKKRLILASGLLVDFFRNARHRRSDRFSTYLRTRRAAHFIFPESAVSQTRGSSL